MSLEIFDIKATVKSKNNASKYWANHNFIYKLSSNILSEKILELKDNFKNILLITSDKNEALEKIKLLSFNKLLVNSPYEKLHEKISSKKIKFISQPFEEICLTKQKFDFLICNLSLHRINNVKSFVEKLFSLLSKNGLLICIYFGGKSLNELRQSLISSDEKIRNGSFQRIIPFIDMIDASNIFQSVGFKEIVCDSSELKIKYKKFNDLLVDIKGMGESNSLIERNKGLMTRSFLNLTEFFYKKRFSDNNNNIIASCELISMVMWKN